MEVLNDCIVLQCSYFLFLFSDYVITQENKDFYGWIFNGYVGLLLVTNLLAIACTVVKEMIDKCKRFRAEKILLEKIKNLGEKVKKKKKFNVARFLKGKLLEELKEDDANEDYLTYLRGEFEKAKEKQQQ